MPKHKCIFCKKYIKGLYRCDLTGQIFKNQCFGYTKTELDYSVRYKNKCPSFTASLYDRICAWVDLH